MNVLEYLNSGKTYEDLTTEFGIRIAKHNEYPLAILNYNQIDSPKTHPIVRECRGLVVDTTNHTVVGKSFNRFFNWGEVADEMPLFDFSNFFVQSKEDGSLVVLYCYNGVWMANTRGSFGTDKMQFQDFTWQEGFCRAMGIKDLQELMWYLDINCTYVCEFCSPWNKVVRKYPTPTMYLLTMFRGLKELTIDEVDELYRSDELLEKIFRRPERYDFTSVEQIQNYLLEQGSNDPTFEGVVICDHKGHRWKVKSATYLSLHRMKGEGDNLFNPKYLLPWIMAGNKDELLVYFEEVKETYEKFEKLVYDAYAKLVEVWQKHWQIESQKDFALAILKQTPFTSILFTVRKKYGMQQTLELLRQEWEQSSDLILKVIFEK